MMKLKSSISLILFLFISNFILAQDPTIYDNNSAPLEKNKSDTASKFLISSNAFNKTVKNIFGQLATGQSSSAVLSNFASLDIAQGKFNFNGSLPLSKRFFVTAALSGDLDNNIGQLFNNYKLNTNTSIDLRIHYRIPGGTQFYFTEEDKRTMNKERAKINNQYKTDTARIASDSAISDINHSLILLIKDSLKMRIAFLKSSALAQQNSYTTSSAESERETARNIFRDNSRELLETTKLYFEQQKKLDSITFVLDKKNEYFKSLRSEALKKQKAATEVLELGADWNAIRIQWLSARINPVRSKFWMLDTLQPYAKQVSDTVVTTAYYGLEYSFYYYSRRNGLTHYFNLGIGYTKTDNRKELNTYDVSDTWKRDSGRTSRNYANKVNAYNGILTLTNAWQAYANYYLFTSGSSVFGAHLFPEIQLRQTYKPQYNFGGGLIFSFKKKGEEKTIINAEPYIKFIDITDALAAGTSAIKRNEIGIRLGLPINPQITKKSD